MSGSPNGVANAAGAVDASASLSASGAASASGAVRKRAGITAVQAVIAVLVVAALGWLGFKYAGYAHDQRTYFDLNAAYASQEGIGGGVG